ncbi:hypothetical protein PO037_11685, partial [Bacteroides thetaiotaomicron]|nr:hypothetical protein [Bacteroides thetaiotaomicron]MDC2135230.1 hypothetical protein [Bacteroides thetaiotaomicron]MDC2139913.1 hypothetical protein [Bacteroides thetaiotaomicron]MDC2144628.1 hypothetical protein [Bacteroides thetaiotaomicron]MDC2149264.1 hypothetical protein [Bacteroides thetaiotaomicron]
NPKRKNYICCDLKEIETRQSLNYTPEFTVKSDFTQETTTGSGDTKHTFKSSYGFTNTTKTSTTIKVTTTVGSDNLGTLSFFFYDPIIRAESNNAYKLYDVSSGDVTATILPVDLITARK